MNGFIKAAILFFLSALGLHAETLLVRHNTHCTRQMAKEFHGRMRCEATIFQYLPWSAVRGEGLEKHYRASPLFDKVETERTYWTSRIPNDPRWFEQWGPMKVSAPMAWDFSFGAEVIVAVIDTGIDFSHPDLVNALWTGPSGEHGYSALGGYLAPGGRDDHLHGTHVAGIIAATMNNSIGIAGLAPNVKLMAMKFLTSTGSGRTGDAALLIEKMIELKRQGVNIRVSNNSWGGFGSDPLLDEAFALAEAEGIINVCAAGNQNVDTDLYTFFPSCIPKDGIISVQASDRQDGRVGFSNYGFVTTDLMAPGIDILSCFTNNDYVALGGTSMASPHVAAACAAMFGRNPSLTVKQCRDLLLSPEARDVTTNVTSSTLGGRLNLFKCVTHPRLFNPPVNHAPTIALSRANTILAPWQSSGLPVTISDADGDVLRTNVVSFGSTYGDYAGFAHGVSGTGLTNSGWAVDGTIRTHISAVDSKGGGAIAEASTFLLRDDALMRDLSQSVTFTASHQGGALWHFLLSGPTNLTTYTVTEHPEGGGADIFFHFQPNILYGVTTHTPTNKAIMHRATVADAYGNFLNTPPVVTPNGSTYRHPHLKVKFNTTRGTVPLNVVADMSETDHGDATNLLFISYDRPDVVDGNPIISFTLTNIGIHVSRLYVVDVENKVSDDFIQIFSVLPPPVVSLERTNGELRVSWLPASETDVLERSGNLTAWAPVSTGLPPVTVPLTGSQRFFRVRQQ